MRLFIIIIIISLLFPVSVFAYETSLEYIYLTQHTVGFMALAVFAIAYMFVILEEQIQLKKSKPVLLAAGIIWVMIAAVYQSHGFKEVTTIAIRHNFLEYSELFFFLLVAMTYINAMLERGVSEALRDWLVGRGYSYRMLFWITGVLAFFISPIADNLTTALIMCAVVMTVGSDNPRFISLSCINIVVAANAGGVFSPFGDITTLMVWQKDIIEFSLFFKLFIPAVINYMIPAIIMHFFISTDNPVGVMEEEKTIIQRGGLVIVGLFLLTIITSISFHNFLHLPPVIGMLTGLAYLKFYGFYLTKTYRNENSSFADIPGGYEHGSAFNVFNHIASSEWDTLFFFYGAILAVGGLGFIGYLSVASEFIYGELGPTTANILVGVMSAIFDNIPVMLAVLTMNPEMSETQW